MTSPRKSRTEITIETHEITIIRTRGKKPSAECRHCRKDAEAVSIERSAALLETSLADIHLLIKTGELHFLRIAEAGVVPLVCGNSIRENRR